MTNEQLLAEIARLEGEIASIQAQISQANALAAQYRMDAQQAEQRRHAAEEDRVRIEGKISGLADSVAQRLELQREMMILKAMSVLAACEMMVNDLRDETNVRFDKLDTRLNEMRDATTGLLSSIENIVLNLFELHREDALTVAEYEAIDLTAGAYDEQMICALDYDLMGKLLLCGYDGPISPISAAEYDGLRLRAEAFEAYRLSCVQYDMAAKALLV